MDAYYRACIIIVKTTQFWMGNNINSLLITTGTEGW